MLSFWQCILGSAFGSGTLFWLYMFDSALVYAKFQLKYLMLSFGCTRSIMLLTMQSFNVGFYRSFYVLICSVSFSALIALLYFAFVLLFTVSSDSNALCCIAILFSS